MTVDSHGNLYIAVSGSQTENGVYVLAAGGQQLAFLAMPEGAINLDFGRGRDCNVLYVTCGHGLYRIRLQRTGFRPGAL